MCLVHLLDMLLVMGLDLGQEVVVAGGGGGLAAGVPVGCGVE